MERPPQIQAHHLEKLAVVYTRQSSVEQVRENTGSTEVQRQLAALPRLWGWPDSRIMILEDQGWSASVPGRRPQYRKLVSAIDDGLVSLLLLHEWSRASRNTREGEELLERIEMFELLVYESGRLFDGASEDLAEFFGLKIKNTLAWWDQKNRTRTFRLAKTARIAQGFAVSPPPFGFVTSSRGKWALHPDPEVREAIRRPFDLYPKLNSIQKVVRYYNEHGLLHPRKAAGKLVWEPITPFTLIRILRNRNYTPDYVYFRTASRHALGSSKRTVTQRPTSAQKVILNHHEGAMTREQWATIQGMLDGNRRANRPPSLDGPALLQGLLWCGPCDRLVKTIYHRRVGSRRLPAYVCQRLKDRRDLHRCTWVPFERVDTVVIPHILRALSLPSFDDAREILNAHAADQKDIERLTRAQLQRAEREVLDYKTRYLAVDPANALVKAELEAEWQRAIRMRDQLRASNSTGQRSVTPLRAEDIDELFALTGQLDTVWQAPTTTNADRKRILASVISRVVIKKVTDEWLDVEIRWKGGFTEVHRVIRSKGIDSAVKELRDARVPDAQIAEQLKARGVLGRGGGKVSRQVVTKRVRRLGIQHRVLWKEGLLRIRALVLEGRTPVEILETLQTNGPRHWKGNWELRIVVDWIRRLRKGDTLHGVPPLPPDPKSAHLCETPEEVLALMARRRDEGRPWRAIADELNATGQRPAKVERFTEEQCILLFSAWRRRTLRKGSGGSADSTDEQIHA